MRNKKKRKFNSDNHLPLNKALDLHSTVIFCITVFLEDNKYYPQFSLNECLRKLEVLFFVRTDVSLGFMLIRQVN